MSTYYPIGSIHPIREMVRDIALPKDDRAILDGPMPPCQDCSGTIWRVEDDGDIICQLCSRTDPRFKRGRNR